MSITVRKRPIKSNIKGHEKNGYCFQAIKKKTKTIDDVLKFSQKGSSIDYREAKAAFEMAIDGFIEYLKDGHPVDMGPLGRFLPTVKGKMGESPDEMTLKNIKIGLNYKISATLRSALAEAQIEIEDKEY